MNSERSKMGYAQRSGEYVSPAKGNDKKNYENLPSIVSILTLNRLDLTKKAVSSVLENSGGDNVRMVFFDNGSAGDTLEYLRDLRSEQPDRVDVLTSRENLGVAKGRNEIFKHILGKYGFDFNWVLNLDNDCAVHEGYDSAITNCVRETGAIAVCPRLIQPDGRIFHDARNGFLINLEDMELKLDYAGSVALPYNDPSVSKRIATDVILGTSAKTPKFLERVGFYDEEHKIGLEDFSIALKTIGMNKDTFYSWRSQKRHGGKKWVRLTDLMNGEKSSKNLVVYEPDCMITHDHPVIEEHESYNRIRWDPKIIGDSIQHFKNIWGLEPVDDHADEMVEEVQ